jgi:hypothetical protein
MAMDGWTVQFSLNRKCLESLESLSFIPAKAKCKYWVQDNVSVMAVMISLGWMRGTHTQKRRYTPVQTKPPAEAEGGRANGCKD